MFQLNFLKEKDIFLDLDPSDKMDIIYQMIKKSDISNKREIFEAIIGREKLETTGIGEGIALPHARTKFVKKIIVKFAVFKNGINFGALDNKNVNFVFLIVAPDIDTQDYLKTLAHIVRIISRKEIKKALLNTNTKKEVLKILQKR